MQSEIDSLRQRLLSLRSLRMKIRNSGRSLGTESRRNRADTVAENSKLKVEVARH